MSNPTDTNQASEDDVLTYPTYPVRLKERNELRAEQRKRIK